MNIQGTQAELHHLEEGFIANGYHESTCSQENLLHNCNQLQGDRREEDPAKPMMWLYVRGVVKVLRKYVHLYSWEKMYFEEHYTECEAKDLVG